jgi:hypothetical protein
LDNVKVLSRKGFGFGLAALVLLPAASFAQTASQITPPSFRPNLERQGGFALPDKPALATPAGRRSCDRMCRHRKLSPRKNLTSTLDYTAVLIIG